MANFRRACPDFGSVRPPRCIVAVTVSRARSRSTPSRRSPSTADGHPQPKTRIVGPSAIEPLTASCSCASPRRSGSAPGPSGREDVPVSRRSTPTPSVRSWPGSPPARDPWANEEDDVYELARLVARRRRARANHGNRQTADALARQFKVVRDALRTKLQLRDVLYPEAAAVAGVRRLGLRSRLRARPRWKAPPPCSLDRAADAERDAARPALIRGRDDLPDQKAACRVVSVAAPLGPANRVGAPGPGLLGSVGHVVGIVFEPVVRRSLIRG
jgi:hypothetical protein